MNHLPHHIADRLTAGLLAGHEEAQARAHAASCAECLARVEQAAQDRAAFLARNPPALRTEALLETPQRTFALWRAWVPALALSLVVTVVLLARPQTTALVEKGGVDLSFVIKRPSTGKVWAGHSGDGVEAGDEVQLVVTPGRWKHVTVYGLDDALGLVQLMALEATHTMPLPRSLVVDGSPAPERVWVVFSQQPIAQTGIWDDVAVRVLSLQKQPKTSATDAGAPATP